MKKTLRKITSVLLAAALICGCWSLSALKAEAQSDTVYIHFHDHEPGESAKDSILYTALVERGDTYAPRPTDVAVSERSEDNIILVVTGWKDADGNVYDETHPATRPAAYIWIPSSCHTDSLRRK